MCEEHAVTRGCWVHQCIRTNMMSQGLFSRRGILNPGEMVRNAEQNLFGGGLGFFCKQMEFVKILIDLFKIGFL